jgi:hypothetical protein
MRILGGLSAVVCGLFVLVLWLVVEDTARTKIAVGVVFVIAAAFVTATASTAAASATARAQDGKLDFFFCGIRTKSFALDGNTTFNLEKFGPFQVLRIHRGRQSYSHNGALDRDSLINLLRANGVREQKAN